MRGRAGERREEQVTEWKSRLEEERARKRREGQETGSKESARK